MKNKLISLEGAREENKLDQFIDEHPSEADKDKFDNLLAAMTKPVKSDAENK